MPLFLRGRLDLPRTPDKWKASLEAALAISEIGASAAALQDSVQAVVKAAIDLLEAQEGSIMLLEDDGRTLVMVASSGLPPEVPPGHRLAVGESIAGRVLATGKHLRLEDVDDDAFVNFVPKARRISSSVVVPLRAQGRPIGVLSLAKSSATNAFTEEDARVAQMFADQAAGVIYRARLHEKAEQRSSDLFALVESSKGLVGTLDLDLVLRRVLDGGTRLTGSETGFACMFGPDSHHPTRGVFRAIDKVMVGSLVESPEVQTAVKNVDVQTFERDDLGLLVAIGLRTGKGTRGALVMSADRRLVEERIDLLRVFGQESALALGAAELHSIVLRKESELSSIIHGVANPIVLVDERRQIVAVNSAAELLFGLSAMFSSGAPIQGALGHAEIEGLLTETGDLQGEFFVGNPPRTYKARVTDVEMPGAPIGRVLVMDDVTSEREIGQVQRDFVSMIGHELRTPLTIIKGFARTLLRHDNVSHEQISDGLSTIDAKAAHLERLIEDLLYVSKVETREASLRMDRIDIPKLITKVASDLMEDHQDREVLLDAPGMLMWPCDETKLELIMRHLLQNALKYSDDSKPVTVRATDEGEHLRVDVVDRGMGILSSDIPRIFERFRQVDSSSTRAHEGAGVGLYLCQQLVRMHDGRIWMESVWGKGSTFSFTLPLRPLRGQVVRIQSKTADAEVG